jgi:hypothetical protein
LALILLINLLFHKKNIGDRANPRIIVGRLPTFIGGGITAPKMEQRRKTTGLKASGQPSYRRGETSRDPWSKLTKTLFQEQLDSEWEKENG